MGFCGNFRNRDSINLSVILNNGLCNPGDRNVSAFVGGEHYYIFVRLF